MFDSKQATTKDYIDFCNYTESDIFFETFFLEIFKRQ